MMVAISGSPHILWANSGNSSKPRICKGTGSPVKPDSRSVTYVA